MYDIVSTAHCHRCIQSSTYSSHTVLLTNIWETVSRSKKLTPLLDILWSTVSDDTPRRQKCLIEWACPVLRDTGVKFTTTLLNQSYKPQHKGRALGASWHGLSWLSYWIFLLLKALKKRIGFRDYQLMDSQNYIRKDRIWERWSVLSVKYLQKLFLDVSTELGLV